MLKIKATIAQKILECIHSISPDVDMDAVSIAGWLEYPPDVSMGDLAFPCFRLSKTLRRAPVQIATAIAEKLNISQVQVSRLEKKIYEKLKHKLTAQ